MSGLFPKIRRILLLCLTHIFSISNIYCFFLFLAKKYFDWGPLPGKRSRGEKFQKVFFANQQLVYEKQAISKHTTFG
jgi:hypothetical protein